MFKKVIKDTSTISIGTLVSRILGFIRDILLARFFGASAILEAFLVAFRLPNLFRSIFAEGFTDSVATPVLSEYNKDKTKVFAIGNSLLSISSVILTIFTAVGIIFSRQLVGMIAPGFGADPVRFELAVSFTRLTFAYLLLIGVSSIMTSMLYSLKKFFIPSINPVFLNVTFIPGVIFFSNYFKTYILVYCVLAAGILEVAFPLFSLKRAGFDFKFGLKKALADPVVKRMFKLFIPRVGTSIVYQLNVFVDTIFSSMIGVVGLGGVAAVYYANRLVQFPFALIALSLSQVAVVDLSGYHNEGDIEAFKKLFVFSFQNIIFFIIPISAFFIFLANPVIDVLFRRGEFDAASLAATSSVLFFYSFGLFFFCGVKLLTTCFYSLKDTATPAKIMAISLLVNIVCVVILMYPLKIGGVALGTSIASVVTFILHYVELEKRIGKINWQDTREQLIKIIVISVILGVVCRLLWNTLSGTKYFKMFIILSVSIPGFIIAGWFSGIKHIHYLKEKIFPSNGYC
jgi:putative peptidoglycan lipid II flippase